MGLRRKGITLILRVPVAGIITGRVGYMGLRRKGITLILWTPVAGTMIGG